MMQRSEARVSVLRFLLRQFCPIVMPRTSSLLRRCAVVCLLCAVSTFAAGAPATPRAPSAALAGIAERYFEDWLALFPIAATEYAGDTRFEGELAIEISPDHRGKQAALYRRVLKELQTLPRRSLNTDDALTHELLEREARRRLEALAFPEHLLPLNHMDSMPQRLAAWAGGNAAQPFKTVENYQNFAKRLARLSLWIDQAIVNMREGMRRGVTQPAPIMERALPQLRELATRDLAKNPFYQPVLRLPAGMPAADRQWITARYVDVVGNALLPSLIRLERFVADEYLPKCRSTAGLGALPAGEAWYRFRVQESTTTNLTPERIHLMGQQEVARIRGELNAIKFKMGFGGDLPDFFKWIETRQDLRPFRREEEVIQAYRAIDQEIKPKLPMLFGRMPKAPLDIRPVDKLQRDTASDNYMPPSKDGARPGVFYTVIKDPRDIKTTGMTALFLHEGQPGHHFHIALQQELALPKFRQFGWNDAYGEGWALYAESLGRELGVYDDDNAYLGRLFGELHRAIRLVVDTGLHSKGWSREMTIRYIMDTEGSTEERARRATERYMAWPGQALSYKVGELKILELRSRAKRGLGDRFDLRAFHDEVLKDGSVPLNVLERKINRWIETRQQSD